MRLDTGEAYSCQLAAYSRTGRSRTARTGPKLGRGGLRAGACLPSLSAATPLPYPLLAAARRGQTTAGARPSPPARDRSGLAVPVRLSAVSFSWAQRPRPRLLRPPGLAGWVA